jgi:hypothetical protein
VLLRRSGSSPDAPKGALFPVEPQDHFLLRVFAVVPCPPNTIGLTELLLPGGRCLETEVVGSPRLAGLAYRWLLATADGPIGAISEDYEWCADGRPLTRVRALPAQPTLMA